MVIKKNARKDKLDKICTKLATFIFTETEAGVEADLQKALGDAISLIDKVSAVCVANDNAAERTANADKSTA